MGLSISSLRKQRGAAGEYTRNLERLVACHSAAVHSALSRAECAEHGVQELRWQLAQQHNSARIDCEALRQHTTLASVREELALARAERAQRELAVLKGELRQLRGECGTGRTSGSEAAVAAVKAVPQPLTPPTVVVRGAALKSALKRPGPQEKKKKKHLRFHDQLVNARYFWRDAAPSHVVRGSTLPSFLSAVIRHHRRERRASSSVGSMRSSVASVKSQHAAQRVATGAKEAVSAASMAQLLGRGEAVTGSSSLEATLKSLFAVASQQPREEAASLAMAAVQLRVTEEPSPSAALAAKGCEEDVAAPPAAAAKAEAGTVVRPVAVAAC